MSKLIRLAVGLLCLGVLALGVFLFDTACPLTFPASENPDLTSSMAEELARSEWLKQTTDAFRRRTEAKEQVARDLIARRRSLAEAIEQFQALDQQWPAGANLEDLHRREIERFRALDRQWRESPTGTKRPGDLWLSEDEWSGQDVLFYVRKMLAHRPDEAAVVAGRLEKELQQLLADRKKRLPRRLSCGRSGTVDILAASGL
jgi:hypothetical protein